MNGDWETKFYSRFTSVSRRIIIYFFSSTNKQWDIKVPLQASLQIRVIRSHSRGARIINISAAPSKTFVVPLTRQTSNTIVIPLLLVSSTNTSATEDERSNSETVLEEAEINRVGFAVCNLRSFESSGPYSPGQLKSRNKSAPYLGDPSLQRNRTHRRRQYSQKNTAIHSIINREPANGARNVRSKERH